MKHIRKIISALILFTEMSALYILIPYITDAGMRNAFFIPARTLAMIPVCIIGFFLFLFINIFPRFIIRQTSGSRNRILEDGAALLQLFLVTTVAEVLFIILYSLSIQPGSYGGLGYGIGRLVSLLILVLMESVLFWNGIIRVYTTSVQLGIKWRIIGIACGFIPFVHIWVLCRIIAITSNEAAFEEEKYLLDQVRAESRLCETKYPLLLVHGVFSAISVSLITGAGFPMP